MAASVQGDNNSSTVTVLINYLDVPVPSIYAILTRTYCGKSVTDTIVLHTKTVEIPEISHPETVCRNELVYFTATGGIGTYKWFFDDNTSLTGNPVPKSFLTAGQHTFELKYAPLNGCDTVTVQGTIFVHELPEATITFDEESDLMTVTQQINTTYLWTFDGHPIGTDTMVEAIYGNGEYCCTVTDTITGCTNKGCIVVDDNPNIYCNKISLSVSKSSCNTYEITAINPTSLPISWTIIPNNPNNSIIHTSQNSITATFGTAGYFIVYAKVFDVILCYSGEILIVIDYVPRLGYNLSCPDTLTVFDNSFYRAGYPIPDRTIEVNCANPPQQKLSPTENAATFILSQVTVPTGCTISMTIEDCTDSIKFTYEPLPSNLQMTPNSLICENTPVLFEASGDNATRFAWNFGDGSSGFGNSIYHTFGSAASSYTVTLTAYNANGCSSTISQLIQSSPNNITGTLQPGPQVCMGEQGSVIFTPTSNIVLYNWSTPPTPTTNNVHFVYASGVYSVTAISDIGCMKVSSANVNFHNAPTAKIIGATCFCAGDNFEYSAYQISGEASGLTYQWSANIGGNNYTSNNPTFSGMIPNPCNPNKFTVYLTVTNAQPCVAKDSIEVEVFAKPAAPIISFAGNTCIGNPPVCLVSSANPPQNLFWNNGAYGDTACYFNPGFVTAYYIDPVSGCRSNFNEPIMICPAPKLDALLTGCFCEHDLPSHLPLQLPVYLLMAQAPYNSNCGTPQYKWYYNNVLKFNQPYLSSTLTIDNFGDYKMTIEYENGHCIETSSTLTIKDCSKQDTCNVKFEPCYKICGKLYFDQMFRVCNREDTTIVFNNLQLLPSAGYSVVSWSPNPLILVPGQCANVIATVRVDSLSKPPGKLVLTDPTINCHSADCNVSIPMFDWKQCTEEDTCRFVRIYIGPDKIASTPETIYLLFEFELPHNSSLLSFWAEPNFYINDTYSHPYIKGRFSFDVVLLREWNAAGIDVCFFAEIAFGQHTCLIKLCYPAQYFLNFID